MKKLLLSLLILFPATSLFADMKKDTTTGKFYSIPQSSYVDQAEYHRLVTKVVSMIEQYCLTNGMNLNTLLLNKSNVLIVNDKTHLYLATIGTPTAERVLMDFMKDCYFGANFN